MSVTQPTAPAWLNLDAVVDAETVKSVRFAIDAVREQLRPTLKALFIARQVNSEWSEGVETVGDDVAVLVRDLTGMSELWNMALLIGGVAGSITGCEIGANEIERLTELYYDAT